VDPVRAMPRMKIGAGERSPAPAQYRKIAGENKWAVRAIGSRIEDSLYRTNCRWSRLASRKWENECSLSPVSESALPSAKGNKDFWRTSYGRHSDSDLSSFGMIGSPGATFVAIVNNLHKNAERGCNAQPVSNDSRARTISPISILACPIRP